MDSVAPSGESSCFGYKLLKLPESLRGYVRYIVVLHPGDCKPYSIGVKYVCDTEGAQGLMNYLIRNVNRKHKKHVHSWLCQSVVDGSDCALEMQCPNIHVTPEGYDGRRSWLRPLKTPRATEDSETSDNVSDGLVEIELDVCLSTPTSHSSSPFTPALSPSPSTDSNASISFSPNIFRPISPIITDGSSSNGSTTPTQELNAGSHSVAPRSSCLRPQVLIPRPFQPQIRTDSPPMSAPIPHRPQHLVTPNPICIRVHKGGEEPRHTGPPVALLTDPRAKHVAFHLPHPYPYLPPQLHSATPTPFKPGRVDPTPFAAYAPGTPSPPYLQAHAPYAAGSFHCGPSARGLLESKPPMDCPPGEGQPQDLRWRQERLEKTRAKLHHTVDWILSNDSSNWGAFAAARGHKMMRTPHPPMP